MSKSKHAVFSLSKSIWFFYIESDVFKHRVTISETPLCTGGFPKISMSKHIPGIYIESLTICDDIHVYAFFKNTVLSLLYFLFLSTPQFPSPKNAPHLR